MSWPCNDLCDANCGCEECKPIMTRDDDATADEIDQMWVAAHDDWREEE